MIIKLTLFFLLVTTSLTAKLYDGVAIVVEDRAITLLDITQEMQQEHIDAKKAADLLIRKALQEIEIQKRGITVTPAEVYADIKRMAEQNGMSVSAFYDAILESNGLTSDALKAKIKEKLLLQKLYNAIAMSSLSEPSESEIAEYYALHQQEFSHPSSFDVVIYGAKDRALLEQKIHNPMFYSPLIGSSQQTIAYDRVAPQLAALLTKTAVGSFTPVVPDGKGGFMSFYIKGVTQSAAGDLKALRPAIVNALMAQKREAVLSDYFARLRDNADINIIRMPQES